MKVTVEGGCRFLLFMQENFSKLENRNKEEYPLKHEFYSIKVDGAKIMVVYKLK